MTDLPLTVITPTIAPLLAGKVTRLRRPQGRLSTLKPGDRLWIREQVLLPRAFDHVSPTQAHERGATPVYAADHADLPDYATADLGKKRFAREMVKHWHRAHLIVTHIALERLHDTPPEEWAEQGFTSIDHYAAGWDAGLTLNQGGRNKSCPLHWRANPAVIAFTFTFVPHPLPDFHAPDQDGRHVKERSIAP